VLNIDRSESTNSSLCGTAGPEDGNTIERGSVRHSLLDPALGDESKLFGPVVGEESKLLGTFWVGMTLPEMGLLRTALLGVGLLETGLLGTVF